MTHVSDLYCELWQWTLGHITASSLFYQTHTHTHTHTHTQLLPRISDSPQRTVDPVTDTSQPEGGGGGERGERREEENGTKKERERVSRKERMEEGKEKGGRG